MPQLLNNDTDALKTVSHFGFSGKRIEQLKDAEYTLAGIAVDVSSSVSDFRSQLEEAYRRTIKACRLHPRAANVMARGVSFNHNLTELHGFIGLDEIEEDKLSLIPDGSTALYDATLEGIEAIESYGERLAKMDYLINGVLYVVTDGENNASKTGTPSKIKATLARIRKKEQLESLKVILIGVGNEAAVKQYLEAFQKDAGLDQFVWIDKTTPRSMAKLTGFVSCSISAISLSLGTGGTSASGPNLTI